MRFMPIILLLAIIANFICVVVFRIKLDRAYDRKFDAFSETLKNQVSKFSSDALLSIDNYFVSNAFNNISSSARLGGNVSSSDSIKNPFLVDGGEWNYHYCEINDEPLAQVGFVIFKVGSVFPRGGSITAIYPDFVVVNDSHYIRNRNIVVAPSNTDTSTSSQPQINPTSIDYKPNKELLDYVK